MLLFRIAAFGALLSSALSADPNHPFRISVSGEVQTPGVYELSSTCPDPVEEALSRAGGLKGSAARNRVLLMRVTESKPRPFDLDTRDVQNHIKLPCALQDGDYLVLQPRRYVILGAVEKSGQFLLEGQENLVNIVLDCVTSRARLDRVRVIRAAVVETGGDDFEVYDLEKALRDGKFPHVPIHDGDLIFVASDEDPDYPPRWNPLDYTDQRPLIRWW